VERPGQRENGRLFFAEICAGNPTRRIGTVQDIASGVVFSLTNSFLTGTTLHIDGGESLT
jgi:NAD(P)-dependent dehydrogenase (short-subunit alcohol dehydrogenase family)